MPTKPDAEEAPESVPSDPEAENAAPLESTLVMSHPSIQGAYGEATVEAFNGVWKGKGWKVVKDEDVRDDWTRPSTTVS